MPGMNGLELARAVREISPEPRVVVMTGLQSRELLEGSERASLEGFILKPFSLAQLQDVLQSLG
jgi:two-component system response regulator YesN